MTAGHLKLGPVLASLAAIAVSGFVGITPSLAYEVIPGERHCVVDVARNDVLNIRAGPSASSEIRGIAKPGACDLTVDRHCRENWCPVSAPTVKGWANRKHLGMVSPARYCVAGVGRNDRLNVRTGPSTGYRTIATLEPDTCGISLAPPYRQGRWARVVLPGRRSATGWVHGRYLSGQ